VTDDRLRDLLSREHVPDEQGAEERARRVVRAAFGQRLPARRAWRLRRAVIGVATALVATAVAFTPPGQAIADWVRDVVKPGEEDARQALVSLPAAGRLLVTSDRGPWIVERDGSKRLLGAYEDASWSPQGLFVVATRGRELVALDPKGGVRWSLARPGLARFPRWSPDGFRIAYLSGRTLRAVAGDGTGDRPVAEGVAETPPAWRPGAGHELAFVDSEQRLNLVGTDSKVPFKWRSAAAVATTRIAWSADGQRLLAMGSRQLRLFDARGRLVSTVEMQSAERAETAEFAPSGRAFALASHNPSTGRSRLTLIGPTSRTLLFSGAGRFRDLSWSPDGRWLLVTWPDADQWVFIRTSAGRRARAERLRAVANISDQFAPGATAPPSFPRLAGWCCP
jgi:Tol biopolymer transport system component